jgi:formylglycine-generating enzyme
MAGRVFISYRRSETGWAARAVFERLWREFPGRVFIDLETIALGADFTLELDHHLEHCEAMLALLRPRWLQEMKDRTDHGEPDYARLEVARALLKSIPVVPVLLDNTPMPKRRDLPADLQALTVRNGLPIVHDTFEAQMIRVVQEVRRVLTTQAGLPAPGANTTALMAEPLDAPKPDWPREPWMHDTGVDAQGRWADFKLRNVVQRMRWIEPGEFWMGSTEAERKRFAEKFRAGKTASFDDEKPRHRVTLTHGYWLADTACTQALWQAVVGENPSHFVADAQLPVDSVSWDDINTHFLPELRRLLGSAGFDLPTEAQWECACRAGTDTAYSFGADLSTAQANFDGSAGSAGGVKGDHRKTTLPAKALPANGWGLHQMHGNLWEWCKDGLRSYTAAPVRDPVGPTDGVPRVLRGGSWYYTAVNARASYRSDNRADVRGGDVGFRLCRVSPIE